MNNLNRDHEDLKLLSVFNYIYGGINLLSLLLLLFVFFPCNSILSLILLSLRMGISIGAIASGRFLIKKKRYRFSFAFACVQCLFFTFLTVLRVFAIITLSRDSVKTLYELENV